MPDEDDKCIATEGLDRPGPYFIRQGHAVPVEGGDVLIPDRFSFAYEHLKDERAVIILRDPRDVAVSAAHHWGMNLEKTLHCMGRGEWPLTHGGGWVEWVRRWLDSFYSCKISLAVLLYKSLRQATLETAHWVLKDCLEINVTDIKIQKVIARQSITARRAYTEQHGDEQNYGKSLQMRFLRKGVVGDWENHFTPEHRQLAEEYFGETMRELEYTENAEWIKC